jgi:hypothetical protein
MLLSVLVAEVFELVQQPSYILSEDKYMTFGREALMYIASQVLLPKLQAQKSVTFDLLIDSLDLSGSKAKALLPDNFHRNVYKVCNVNTDSFQIYNSEEAQSRFDIIKPAIVVRQPELLYISDEAVLDAFNLQVSYYKKPLLLTDTDVELDNIFSLGYEQELVREYIQMRAYKWIEDAEEGPLTNTIYHRDIFLALLADLDRHIRDGQSRPGPHRGSFWV